MSFLEICRVVFGSIFILFLPGFIWTGILFSRKEIDFLERFALSFALSISIVPLFTFYLNLGGVKINTVNVLIINSSICLVGLIVLYFKNNRKNKLWKK